MINKKLGVPTLKPIYNAERYKTFRELLNRVAEKYKNRDAFILKEKIKGTREVNYKNITFKQLKLDVDNLGTGLMDAGISNKRVAIIGENSYPWIVSYLACVCGPGLCIPLDKGLPLPEIMTSLKKSGAEVLIFDKKHIDMVQEIRKKAWSDPLYGDCLAEGFEFIAMEDIDGFSNIELYKARGQELLENGNTDFVEVETDPDRTSIFLFTSGTTSMAKAVMLSQTNILANIYYMGLCEDIREGDVNMAFLPYHHTFGSTGQVIMLYRGATTVFCDGLKYIKKNIAEYHVSIFVGVPLLIEGMYKKIIKGIEKSGGRKKFDKAIKFSNLMSKLHIDIKRKLFSQIHEELGGSLRYVISGASPLDPVTVKGFSELGITVVQGYGMTECSPVIAAENPQFHKPGSVGRALYGTEVRLENVNEEGIGELLVKSESVMQGYYEDPEETDKVLVDGWLKTGDLARIDNDGFIFLTGRSKNVIVLKNGKNVYPEELEIMIGKLPYVIENIVTGEQRHKDGNHKDLALLSKIVYDPEYMEKHRGVTDPEEIYKMIKSDIDDINKTLPSYKQILRVATTDKPMEKTTTGKVKRYK